MEQLTHKERMEYLKKYEPITYSEMTSDPTGAGEDGDLGAALFFILVISLIVFGFLYFFGGK